MIPVIHAVTTDEIVARPGFVDRAAGVMRVLGARGAVQLRAPRTAGGTLHAIARELAEHQEPTGAWLIVTDRVDVAVGAGAHGAQLTGRSMDVADARLVAPSLPLGASVHSVAEARAAAQAGAAWLVVAQLNAGGQRVAAPRALRELVSQTTVPVVVLGGVTPAHVRGLRGLGAYGVAAIRGFWEAASPEDAAAEYVAAYAESDVRA